MPSAHTSTISNVTRIGASKNRLLHFMHRMKQHERLRNERQQASLEANGWPTGMCMAIQQWTRRPCTKPLGHHGHHHHDPPTWERRT